MNDVPCDFLVYLEQRLGKSTWATLDMLGEWLQRYEPKQPGVRACEPPLAKSRPRDDATFAA
jgi:hypothetical protein